MIPKISFKHDSVGLSRALGLVVCALFSTTSVSSQDGDFCPDVYRKGVLSAPFNVAFLHVQGFDQPGGGKRDGLLISSFFNVEKDSAGSKVERVWQRDLVARILGAVIKRECAGVAQW